MSVCLLFLALTGVADARSGSHGPAVSTWDSRASSVVFAYDGRSQSQGRIQYWNYNTNFSSTNGRLSSQFGLHFVVENDLAEHAGYGASIGAVTYYAVPVAGRFANGVPKVALAPYIGPMPTVLVGPRTLNVSLPMVFGVGLSLSPTPWLTFTPSVETGMAAEFDARVHVKDLDNLSYQAVTGGTQPTGPEIRDAVDGTVAYSLVYASSGRVEVLTELHFSDRLGLAARAAFGSLDRAGWGTSIGAGLVFHWDRVVPAVLPVSVPEPL